MVEQKDRLTPFGFRYRETLLEIQGRTIEVAGPAENNTEDLLHDLASIVTHFFDWRNSKQFAEQILICIEQAMHVKDNE